MQAFEQAGVRLAAIDVAEVAQRNLGALYEQDERGLAFLAFDDQRGLLTFTRNGELYALRHIDVGARALDVAQPHAARQPLYERIALELQRSLDNFDRQFSQVALRRLVVAPFAGRDALVHDLQDMLSVPVEAVELGEAIDYDGDSALGDDTLRAGWLPALGLALRQEGAP
jgi:MSHA biogenesis protein MshI